MEFVDAGSEEKGTKKRKGDGQIDRQTERERERERKGEERRESTASTTELNILFNIFMPEAARGFGHGAFSVNVQCTYGYSPHVIHVYIHTCTRARSLFHILEGK